MNDILPKLDVTTVSFIKLNEDTGNLELTEEIEYEEDEDVVVNLHSGTEINTLEHLNKVIKYMLEETTIKLKGISAEEFVAGKINERLKNGR